MCSAVCCRDNGSCTSWIDHIVAGCLFRLCILTIILCLPIISLCQNIYLVYACVACSMSSQCSYTVDRYDRSKVDILHYKYFVNNELAMFVGM